MSRAARLGAFIVATLAILVAGVFIIGGKQYMFTPTYRLKAEFSSVVGLDSGAEVRVGGVHAGTVRSVVLPGKPADKITVWMDLDRSSRNIIRKDSVASIQTEGLLGNEYVAISFGSSTAPDVVNGDTIGSVPPMVIADLVKKADGILDSSQEALNNVTVATGNIKSISAKINQGEGTVGALVNDKKIYAQLDETTAGLRDTVVKAQAGMADFQENMEAMKKNFLVRGYFKNRGYENSADLVKNEIPHLPDGAPLRTFNYNVKELFDKVDTAKAKNQKSLRVAGQFLADNEFGLAVIVVSTNLTGDAQKDLVLTQARASVVRNYLVENFGFDDVQLKTMGLGKKSGVEGASDWGALEIVVFPPGTGIPTN